MEHDSPWHPLTPQPNRVDHAVTWKILKDNMRPLMVDLAFPLLCHSAADDLLWREDPYEYLRSKFGTDISFSFF